MNDLRKEAISIAERFGISIEEAERILIDAVIKHQLNLDSEKNYYIDRE